MGISLEAFRCRIGLFNFCGGTNMSSVSSNSSDSFSLGFKHVPVAVLGILLLIAGVEPNPGPEQVCKHCRLKFQTIAQFCDHVKIHQSTKNFSILCGFPGCQVRLASAASYSVHVTRTHVRKVQKIAPDSSQSMNLPCPVSSCVKKMSSREFYNKHMVEKHLKKGDTFQCIFEGCNSKLSYISQFRTHTSRYHRETDFNVMDTASENIPIHDANESENDENYGNFVLEGIHDELGSDSLGTDLYPDFLVKDELARFYLKLEAVFVLPSSTVQAIAEEVKVITELSHYRLKRALQQELENLNLNKDVVASVLKKTFLHDTVFNVHHKHEDVEQLGTHHTRSQYWQKNYPFVKPQEIILGVDDIGKSRRAHYVSIHESLKILLKDPKVNELVIKSFDPDCCGDSQIIRDYTDGTAYQDHQKTHEGPCLQLLMFQDAFDFNPFGPSSGLYKPVGFYYTLGNIPPLYRSKVDLIQLVYMILENDLKPSQEEELKDEDKMKRALKPLLDELKELKENGIEIDGRKVHVCLMFSLGDSLGQNTIGGYVKNFSGANFSCRFCPMSKSEFLETPHETKPFRTAEQYNKYVNIAKKKWSKLRKKGLEARKKAREQARRLADRATSRCSAPSKKVELKGLISKHAFKKMCAVNFKGVRYRPSPLNSEETGFHVVAAQPPCLAHDLFEGIIKSVVAQILKYFIEEKNWFDLSCLNRRIKAFKCKSSDARDAPTPLKSLEKLSGNACENWNLLRLLPFMISDLIEDQEDPMWQLYLSLKEICEFVCAPSILTSQVSYLQFLIESYLARVKELLPSCLTPKHHYLCHYPDLIVLFGPLIRLFTLRFESKHAFFKTVVRACKSYMNITYTMANKYMCRFAYDHSSDILPLDVVYNSNFTVGLGPHSLSEDVRGAFPPGFDICSIEDLKEVSVNGINYSKGFCFVLGSEGTGVKVGCIEMILLQRSSSKIMFLLQEKFADNSFKGYYIIQKGGFGFRLSTIEDLPDYYALATYNFGGEECISLKHTVITMHS